MKRLHEKELWEYTKKDHLDMALWHLRRIGVPDKAMEWYNNRIIDMYSHHDKNPHQKF
jgi:hypothetical protein